MPGELPEALTEAAAAVFADELPRALRYAELLATDGVERGLLGPREADRVWDRHVLNSAAVAGLVPSGAQVVDVGSGAGLPGIPLALARADLAVVLLEPLLRRVTFLEEIIAELRLAERVGVVRGRAPEDAAALPFRPDCVTARAVAPLERLLSWTMPLVRPDGELLALRGSSAAAEIEAAEPALARFAGGPAELLQVGGELLPDPVTVVRVVRRRTDVPSPGRAARAVGRAAARTAGRRRNRPPRT